MQQFGEKDGFEMTLQENLSGYYTLPFSGEGFEGEVIKLDREGFGLLYNQYGWMHSSEHDFRERLHKMDEWFVQASGRAQQNYVNLVTRFLHKDMVGRIDF